MQLFNVNTEEASYISNLLKTNYIPTVPLFNSEMNLGGSSLSIYIPSKETFILDSTLQINTTSRSLTELPIAVNDAHYLSPYVFGKHYPNITSNYILNKRYYDTDLHEYLGRYLRAYRDYYNVDVMNFYNCFSNRFITNYSLPITFKLTDDVVSIKFTAYDSRYKLIAFPIEWDREYTIKFYDNNISDIGYQAVYFNGSEPLGYVDSKEITTIGSGSDPTIFKIKVELNNPALALSEETLNKRLHLKNLLYLFIRFPSIIEGPIVVLEQPTFTRAINNSLLNLDRNIDYQIAFSDRLLEYLTRNVICPSDPIKQNIHLIQKVVERITPSSYVLKEHVPGTFDLDLQKAVYYYLYNKEGIQDFIGFIDKDVEKRLSQDIAEVRRLESTEVIRNGITYK